MDPLLKTPTDKKSGCPSTFQNSLDEYINSLPDNKRKKNFIAACYNPSNPVTPEIVLDSIKKNIEVDQSQKLTMLSKVIRKVVSALKDYDGVVQSLASADPMPTAIIWGALSIVINGAQRHYELLDTIKNEMRNLAIGIERIHEYEKLFGECPILQKLFCDSYINMFRFWNKVHKEITKPGYKSVASAAFSGCLKKLKDIVKQINEDAERMEEQFVILSEQKAKEEREKADQERDAQSNWRKKREDDEMKTIVCDWLRKQNVTPANLHRHEDFQNQRMNGTCDWLSKHPDYIAWLNRTTCTPILRLYAPPGSGKSTLCSHAIQSVQMSDPPIAVAYHFYRFDEPFKACEVLQHFALRLFHRYMHSNYSSDVLKDLAQKVQGEMGPLRCAEELITSLVKNLPEVYFFLDGLDEESVGERWTEADTVLNVLLKLTQQWPNTVRVWISSQNADCIMTKFEAYPALDIKEEMKKDMIFYLSSEMENLEVCEADKESVLQNVDDGAAGNFLWAKLMIKDLKKANSPADMNRIVKEGPTLDDYFKKYFERLETNDRSLACYIFALVAFARRPLRIKELQEAVGMLRSRDAHSNSKTTPSLNRAEMPYVHRMRRLFAPLIEVESDCNEENNGICRLYHSIVLNFLQRNPRILCNGSHKCAESQKVGLQINPKVIADACLLYLSQERYSCLLVSRPGDSREWFDIKDESVAAHHFLTYSAKYWDKHFDWFRHDAEVKRMEWLRHDAEGPWTIELEGFEEDLELHDKIKNLPEILDRITAFLNSPNFQTCIQVQSLFVDSHFGIFRTTDNVHLKRVFPDWFLGANPIYKINYHHFWYEWKLLLDCGTSEYPTCPFNKYAGEIDRCWWAALGPRNFLSKMPSRYISFRFQTDNDFDQLDLLGYRRSFEGVTTDGDGLKILRLSTCHHGELKFNCQHWKLSGDGPILQKTQILLVQDNSTSWLQYMQNDGKVSDPSRFTQRKDRALPVDFSQECDTLRIGTQIYARNGEGEYVTIPTFSNKRGRLPYIEEFSRRGQFVVVANRRCAIAETRLQDPQVTEPATNKSEAAKVTHCDDSSGESDYESDNIGEEDDSGTSDESDDEAYESWSDCSSEDSQESQLEDVACQGPTTDDEETDPSDPEPSEDAENEDVEEPNDDMDDKSSESDPEDIDPRTFQYGQRRNYGEEYLSDEDEWHEYRTKRKGKPVPSRQLASLNVFDVQSAVPKQVFHFSRTLPFILYDSPPVFHPSQSLVVWPLGSGYVLFADFLTKTFFTRKLRPSTLHTRHIFMKCQFSACGRFLHFASLEGQHNLIPKRKRAKNDPGSQMKLALLVSTYRLCNRQASRSPPSLIHVTKVELGPVASLSVSNLPFTLTWRPKVLYFTRREVTLQVFQIHLFNPDKESIPSVTVPREMIILPDTAVGRDVYYFPPADGSAMARIILGSDPSRTNSPPIGCFVHEQRDIGAWVKSGDHTDIREKCVGQFSRPMEKFDPEEDCDLEPFLFLG